MKFLISGGTGLIGSKLTSHLIDNGHSVNILSRRHRKSNNSRIEYFIWKPSEKVIDKSSIKGVDVIINLAGSSVFSLWTNNNKKKDSQFKDRFIVNFVPDNKKRKKP